MSNEHVLYRVEDGVAWLTLNRPDRLNAMTNALMQGICDGLKQVDEDQTVRVVVITGAGRGFCAGADLQQVVDPDPSSDDNVGQTAGATHDPFNSALAALKNCPVPTIAKVNGAAAGGGLGLALACDITIAAESAFFVATFGPNLGIVPDMGTTWSLPRRIGRARALGMSLTGKRLSASEVETLAGPGNLTATTSINPEGSLKVNPAGNPATDGAFAVEVEPGILHLSNRSGIGSGYLSGETPPSFTTNQRT